MLADLKLLGADKIWSLETASPAIWRRLETEQRWVTDTLSNELKSSFPTAPTLEPFKRGSCARPPRHNRAFYISHASGGVLAVKGSEITDPELERAFRQHASLGVRCPATEEFPLREQKLPFAVLVPEALDEANLTARFQETYLARFGELARIPIHLAVYRCGDALRDEYLAKLKPFASERTRQLCELLGRDGLAVYLYYYPYLPHRIAHIVPKNGLGVGIFDAPSREAVLKSKHGFDSRRATDALFSIVGKMLALGFFPLSMASYGIGYCTSAQNVTVQGDIVDTESLFPFASVKSDWEFATTFLTTLATLCATAKVLLHSPLPFVRFEFPDPSTLSMLLSELVWDRIRKEVSACATAGLEIDGRLEQLLAQPSYGKIMDVIAKMHPKREDFFLAANIAAEDNRGWD